MVVQASVFCKAASAVVFLCLLTVNFTSFANEPVGTSWQAPSTFWGVPDFQGTWTNATITGLERPVSLKTLVLTPEEATGVERWTAKFYESIDKLPEGDLQAGADVGGYNTFWMDPGRRLARVRGEIHSSLIVDPTNGKLPYSTQGWTMLTKRLLLFQNVDNPETRLLGERCIVGFGSSGGPPMLPVLYNNFYQIVQSPGFVVILVEMNHDARIVRIGGTRLPKPIRPWLGDSVGRWDGHTLVVETTQFHRGQNLRASLRHRIYMSPDAKVVERFTRVSSDEILYEFSVDDPATYTQTWKGEVPMLQTSDPLYEYACHEGNYSLTSILAGARQADREAQ